MKAVKMWAVFNTAGDLMRWSLAYFRKDAISEYMSQSTHAIGDGLTWPEIRKMGYTCRRVTVTPDAGGAINPPIFF